MLRRPMVDRDLHVVFIAVQSQGGARVGGGAAGRRRERDLPHRRCRLAGRSAGLHDPGPCRSRLGALRPGLRAGGRRMRGARDRQLRRSLLDRAVDGAALGGDLPQIRLVDPGRLATLLRPPVGAHGAHGEVAGQRITVRQHAPPVRRLLPAAGPFALRRGGTNRVVPVLAQAAALISRPLVEGDIAEAEALEVVAAIQPQDRFLIAAVDGLVQLADIPPHMRTQRDAVAADLEPQPGDVLVQPHHCLLQAGALGFVGTAAADQLDQLLRIHGAGLVDQIDEQRPVPRAHPLRHVDAAGLHPHVAQGEELDALPRPGGLHGLAPGGAGGIHGSFRSPFSVWRCEVCQLCASVQMLESASSYTFRRRLESGTFCTPYHFFGR